jgi:hypothetical protein
MGDERPPAGAPRLTNGDDLAFPGVTKREWLTGRALTGVLMNAILHGELFDADRIGRQAVEAAEGAIRALNERRRSFTMRRSAPKTGTNGRNRGTR